MKNTAHPHSGSDGDAVDHQRQIHVARFFQSRRIESGQSIETLARCLGHADATTLTAYENGSLAIPLDEIFALTNYLNIPPEDVFGLIFDLYNSRVKL